MKRSSFNTAAALSAVLALPQAALAGMPMWRLTEMGRIRLSTLSFFLLMFVLLVTAVWKLWNVAAKDFDTMPRLSFRRAFALVLVWGLAFHLVLTMISGTRELMTPEAWESAGVVHKLTPDAYAQYQDTREFKLDMLKDALRTFAEQNDGRFPTLEEYLNLPEKLRSTPTGKDMYIYTEPPPDPGLMPLAYEPESYGQNRMTLLTDGSIQLIPYGTIPQPEKTHE